MLTVCGTLSDLVTLNYLQIGTFNLLSGAPAANPTQVKSKPSSVAMSFFYPNRFWKIYQGGHFEAKLTRLVELVFQRGSKLRHSCLVRILVVAVSGSSCLLTGLNSYAKLIETSSLCETRSF
jgi:hypothetical protein